MTFEQQLSGGHPNSLGNTVEVVEMVLQNPSEFEELFHCYFSDDEVVRLRVPNAMKRICKEQKELLIPYLDRLLTEVAAIDQPSTQWTLAQLFLMLDKDLSKAQKEKATDLLKNNLIHHEDWIVLNQTMDTLGKWARNDPNLANWLIPQLQRISGDQRKSVSKKALKTLKTLEEQG